MHERQARKLVASLGDTSLFMKTVMHLICGKIKSKEIIVGFLRIFFLLFFCLAAEAFAQRYEPARAKPATVLRFEPRTKPIKEGEFVVGVITIAFLDTAPPGSMSLVREGLNTVIGASANSDLDHSLSADSSRGMDQTAYFKLYSNGIAWPKIAMMPDEQTCYQDPYLYGYYCEYDYWDNPMGWQSEEEGAKRVEKMNRAALQFAQKAYRGESPDFFCYNYLTTRPQSMPQEANDRLKHFYQNRGADPDSKRKIRVRKVRSRDQINPADDFDPWQYYRPIVKWGAPMWPNSKVQINDSAGGVLAHELGHCLGAPDVYRIGRFNEGIGGAATMFTYGPTANAFSRFYHHGFIEQKHHPLITKPGTYILHPRHIDPKNDEVVGYLIPTNHPHYAYHVEYVYQENDTVGIGPNHEGLLVSVVNLGRENYTGSPDYFYTYRPDDAFFRGKGRTEDCWFGVSHGRTEFGPQSDPPSRLPNLLDGGIRLRNIQEKQGTLSFEVEMTGAKITGREYEQSMLPQIRLDRVTNVQATSFTMDATIKFRGEPVKQNYGFCWSTSPMPTVKNETYNLCHQDVYRGHALHLKPETTYYVRAYADNGVGIRYSDEQLTVKTPALLDEPRVVEPLCIDQFTNNGYLRQRYSWEVDDTGGGFIGYSPTCVLAKFLGYYRPQRFASAVGEDEKARSVDFQRMNWDPAADFPLARLDEVDGFFQSVYDQGMALGMHQPMPDKKFLSQLVKLTGVRSKPQLDIVTADNISEISAKITHDLRRSRPVMILYCQDVRGVSAPPRWGMIHGVDGRGWFTVDFPLQTKFFLNNEMREIKSGPMPAEFLLIPSYRTHVITSCYFEK